ncbi:MAG TPA: bifunctional demethylmenaquinone methyltransferase/2-methoxy-6-polyprenyl-1,4-benzoquinol methylase UbiE [Nitrospiria bacterium]|nr:bifunctional demethylmenaquinone methyltransferase/2-methoxy-6-polyprenyl-1,4-benzoquinol methylase UbiE [Candidatus Manganitrophaceae bacterium]HIL34804.1 bifunctional demethylmenaquinone methyltransferase/2-methoxy-6-polyprenyl-1,4-benzoquinol methylase UbiE [Candidatus Manganitrophaceae bacterium]
MNMQKDPSGEGKEKAVQAMFSSIARFYDLNNSLLSLGLHHRWKKRTLEAVALCPGEKVIDIGAGTADLSILAAAQVGKNGVVITSDLNEAMLRIGLKKVQDRRLSQVLCLLGNAEELPLPDTTFDVALTGFCIRNLSDLDQGFREIYRVLRPGGRMACLDFSRPVQPLFRKFYDFYSFTLLPKIGTWISKDQTGIYQYLPDSIRKFPDQEDLIKRIEAAGFRDVSYQNLTGGIVAIHFGKK